MGILLSIGCKEVHTEDDVVLEINFDNVSEKEITCALAAAMHNNEFLRKVVSKAVLLSTLAEIAAPLSERDSDSENSPDSKD